MTQGPNGTPAHEASGMHVAFRCDASLAMGSGHVMRCLTLAEELKGMGANCIFLCRLHAGNLSDYIRRRGFAAISLPTRDEEQSAKCASQYESWLGATWREDAEDCLARLACINGDAKVDWLVVDHYGVNRRWEEVMRPSCTSILAIDDLANRQHQCDLLLDQNFGRTAQNYAGLIPSTASALTGPTYALLRPEFAALRESSLARRKNPGLKRILITLGGMDSNNATGRVLDALEGSNLPNLVNITVVMGEQAPWLNAVQTRSANMRMRTEVIVATDKMALLMAESDLVIGAGGSTTWERCALGLPAITIVIAQNQEVIARRMADIGSTLLATLDGDTKHSLLQVLNDLSLGTLSRLSDVSREICDGAGSARVVRNMVM